MKTLDTILTKILWNRLISIVDEAAVGLVRSCYSINLRDFHDYCIGIFDPTGKMLVHCTDTTPGFIGIMPEVMKNFLSKYPADTISEGDVLATNDSWLGTGHLPDITIAAPIFYNMKLIGFVVCVAHHLDIGGRMASVHSRDMYEEGLRIPILKLYEAGKRNDTVFEFLRVNVRVSHQVIGDVNAQLVAAGICVKGVLKMIAEYGFDDLNLLADTILRLGERSMRQQIRALPNGVYKNAVRLPPFVPGAKPVEITAAITVDDDEIVVDYTGSNDEVDLAVNVVFTMTISYTNYAIKLALDPTVPNNAGCLAPIRVVAPPGILNCRPPVPTWGRAMVTHYLPEILLQALAQAIPDRVVAGSGSTPLHTFYFNGQRADGKEFLSLTAHMGGFGASSSRDGYSCLSFPYNIASIPVEAIENETCLLYESKELAPDTAGEGRHRGGYGQEIVIRIPDDSHAPPKPVHTSVRGVDRSPDSIFPISGRFGGQPGTGSHLSLNGDPASYNRVYDLAPGDMLRLVVPGGGGFGDPLERQPDAVLEDVRAGLLTRERARAKYCVVVRDDHSMDLEATSRLRQQHLGSRREPELA
jgi:N-methylhydantoinase B